MKDPFSETDTVSGAGLELAQTTPKELNLGGIAVWVYGTEKLKVNLEVDENTQDWDQDVSVMIFMHGRKGKRTDLDGVSRYILGKIWEKNDKTRILSDSEGTGTGTKRNKEKVLLIVTFWARNHGPRAVNDQANDEWSRNITHPVDLYSITSGTAADVSHIISFLPLYLFPSYPGPAGESPIKTWICAGHSLGGHTVWHAAKDQRITHLIPMSSSPDYTALLTYRSIKSNIPLIPPSWPTAFNSLLQLHSSSNTVTPNQHILVIAGRKDKLVPFVEGKAESVVEELRGKGVDVA